MSTTRPYVVFGANGRTGSAAAKGLLEAGVPVRVVLRDPAHADVWQRQGASVAIADVTDPETTRAAVDASAGAYVLGPQEYGREDLFERAGRIADVYAEAIRRADVGKVVVLSSIGADRDRLTGWIAMNRMLEQRLGDLNQPVAFLRAAYFMENWIPMIAMAAQSGRLPSYLSPSERQIAMIAAADVGRAAATLLLDDWTGERTINLGGPRCYSPDDVSGCLATLLHRPIAVDALEEEQWPSALSAAGFSTAGLRGFVEMTQSLNSGHIAFEQHGEAWSGETPLCDAIAAMASR